MADFPRFFTCSPSYLGGAPFYRVESAAEGRRVRPHGSPVGGTSTRYCLARCLAGVRSGDLVETTAAEIRQANERLVAADALSCEYRDWLGPTTDAIDSATGDTPLRRRAECRLPTNR